MGGLDLCNGDVIDDVVAEELASVKEEADRLQAMVDEVKLELETRKKNLPGEFVWRLCKEMPT